MSQDYELAVVPISTLVPVQQFMTQEIQLTAVMGVIPTQELTEVLASPWAKADGWQVMTAGRLYQRQLAAGVELELAISEHGVVSLRRATTGVEVEGDLVGKTAAEQQALLQAVEPEYNRSIGELVGRTIAAALPRVAAEQGYKVLQTTDIVQNNEVHGIEVRLVVSMGG